ncbi:MAG TPA: recombinase family protein, partial [Reyranellaceae bacterium]|nr:recombinase family protein [Reyranellaceae bacterium]
MTKTAVIYARVSDKKQAEEEVSVPAQIEAGQRKALDLGADVLRVFADIGRSAFKESNRPEFAAAVEFATSYGCDYFVTWSSSRFARNRAEASAFKRVLDRAGVNLVYLSTTIDRSTDEGWILDSMFELIDEMYSRQNSKDTRRSMLRNAQMGYFCGGRLPYGFRTVPADHPKRRRLEVVEDEAAIVREIFALRATGLGAYSIAAKYNAEGLRYRGRPWSKAVVLNVLRCDAVAGYTVFNRVERQTRRVKPRDQWIVVQSHPPIIEPAQWEAVQSMMDAAAEATQHGSPRSGFAFTGLLRCGTCGSSMQIETGKGRGGKLYSYYACRRSQQGEGCRRQRYPAQAMDEWLSGEILDRVLCIDNLREVAREMSEHRKHAAKDRDARRAALVRKGADIEDRNARLFDLLELHGRDAPNLGDLTQRLRANNEEIKALKSRIAELDAEPIGAGEITDDEIGDLGEFVRQMLTKNDNAARARAFYGTFLSGITIDG